MTGLPRRTVPVTEWPDGARVAVAFVLYVESWGIGMGPSYRPEMTSRRPDFVNESFRQYSIGARTRRVARLFAELEAPLSIALSASYPAECKDLWEQVRATVPHAGILAHGSNNSDSQLPIGEGDKKQASYIQACLDSVESAVGARPTGWSSPSVYCDADTFAATMAAGLLYTLDAMDSDHLSMMETPAGDLLLIPYPTQTVDMGLYLSRNQNASDIEQLWRGYIGELIHEAHRYRRHFFLRNQPTIEGLNLCLVNRKKSPNSCGKS